MIIGICGKSGSGKSTLANQIIEATNHKAIHLDIDKIGHNVLTIDEVKKELIKSFGDSIIKEEKIDRKELGELIFNSRNKMKKLSDITWKYMQIEIDNFLKNNNDKIVILDWLLLPISKYFDMCNIKVLLEIPYETRKQRAIKKDRISEEAFESREKATINYNIKDFDYIFTNNNKEIVERLVRFI